MKKVLIWNHKYIHRNIGGPVGYVYNLYEYLKAHPSSQISFVTDINPGSKISERQTETPVFEKAQRAQPASQLKLLILKLFPFIRSLKDLFKQCKYAFLKVYEFGSGQFTEPFQDSPELRLLNEFDYIHFHILRDLSRFKVAYPDYKGKLILTSHCPCPVTDEMLTYYESYCKWFRSWALKNECLTYKAADYLMFPVEGAREPYEKELKIKSVFESSEDKFFYVPSSIVDVDVDKTKMQKLKDLGIPDDAFVITYFGRHNSIKGYDYLVELGKSLLEIFPNLYFLCAGKGDILPYKHPRWIELGFISNTHELLCQSDLYILPNRETYFDLVALEVLRAGTCLVLSDTGGNKHFHSYPADETMGLYFYPDGDMQILKDIVSKLIQEKSGSPASYQIYGKRNRELYLQYFTPEKYVENYINSINSL